MINNNDYEKSLMVADFVKVFRDILAVKKNMTDILFTPVAGGYEICFVHNTEKVRVTAFVKGFFRKKLRIKKYIDGKLSASYIAQGREEIFCYAEEILSE